MHLSERLQRVAANVLSGGVVADIGCDHGFTSIYLVQEHRTVSAIAMDVNQGPLKRAKEHILQYGMSDRISLRLSDGLSGLLPGEADTILISGMGGALTARILTDGREVTAAAKELVLSPQSEVFLVRRCVHRLGFRIASEEMLSDQGKYYVVIRAVPGNERYEEEIDYLYGRKLMDRQDKTFFLYMEKEEARVNKVLCGLPDQGLSAVGKQRKKELQQERAQIQKVLNRISCQKEGGRLWEDESG
ncbi:SAM-dependent methyltransferase [bacterium D16-51]|nr:SAM-dependent methyltransferase [bacterium D16-59]RKI59838.1 SAM-dependent methyltransferase [bacterium D16-51]